MSVKSETVGDILRLELDNGDRDKLEKAMDKWGFKDHQSLLRFSVSMLLENQGSSFFIKEKDQPVEVAPSKDLLK